MILEPKEVTQDKLVEILKNAAFDIEVQESGIYIKDTSFPIWLNIDNKKQLIKLYTCVKFKETVDVNLINDFISDCNSTYDLVQFLNINAEDNINYFYGFYFIYFNFGIIPQHAIYTIRQFSSVFVSALREKDSNDIYLE